MVFYVIACEGQLNGSCNKRKVIILHHGGRSFELYFLRVLLKAYCLQFYVACRGAEADYKIREKPKTKENEIKKQQIDKNQTKNYLEENLTQKTRKACIPENLRTKS